MSENDKESLGHRGDGFEERQAAFHTGRQESSNHSPASDLSSIEYFNFLLKHVKLLLLAIFAGFVLSISCWFQVKDAVTVTFPVRPLPTFENSRYAALNNARTDSIFRDTTNPITPIPDVVTGKLLYRFIEKLQDSQSTLEIAKSSQLFNGITDSDERDAMLVSYVRNIVFEEPATEEVLERGRGSRLWTVTLNSLGVSETLDFLDKWISQSTAEVRNELVEEVEQAIRFNDTRTERVKEDLTAEREIVISDYNRKLRRTVETLKEDAAVARSAGIESNVLTGSIIGDASGILAVEQGTERYLRGYVSLEEEIKLLQQRETPEPYASALDTIDERLDKLNADTSIARIKQAFEESPLKTGEFRAVSLRPIFINVAPDNSPVLFSILGLLLGTIIGFGILTLGFLYITILKPHRSSVGKVSY